MTRFLRSTLGALLCGAIACSWLPGGSSTPRNVPRSPPAGEFVDMVCGLPRRDLVRTLRGYRPGHSGDVQMIPREGNTFGDQHAGPWEYLQRVPMLFYGPGHVPPIGNVRRRVTMADVAPTLARFLRFDFTADGRPMKEAVGSTEPPPLILVVVWDGGGRNVLDTYPQDWPTVRGMIPRGAWFDRAVVGTSPSVTPPVHATLGTGAFPAHHGLVDLYRRSEGRVITADEGLRLLLTPTVGEAWDRATGNRAHIGVVANLTWHLAMASRGSLGGEDDRDLAVMVNERRGAWTLEGPAAAGFRFPSYVDSVPAPADSIRAVDLEDGLADGTWLGSPLRREGGLFWVSPAFIDWQTRVLTEIIRREGFGADDVPDLLFTNYKQIDGVGHRWGLASQQMRQVLRGSDKAFGELADALDKHVGKGRWVMVLTADHGVVPPASATAFRISRDEFLADVEATFDGDGDDRPVVDQFRATQLWIDRAELSEKGHSIAQVAAFAAGYTKGENVRDRSALPSTEADRAVLAAAFPSETLTDLPCLPADVTTGSG